MEQINGTITEVELTNLVNNATPEQIFNLYADMMGVNLTQHDILHKVLKTGEVFAVKTNQFDIYDEKVGMIPENLEYQNDQVVEMSKGSWERFQQKLKEQNLEETKSRTR